MKYYARKREQVKAMILDHMKSHCHGFRNAKRKDSILSALNAKMYPDKLTERALRLFIAELRKEGHLSSHNSNPPGHWFRVLVTNDPEEIEAILRSLHEKKAKALSMLEGVNREIAREEEKLQKQERMSLT